MYLFRMNTTPTNMLFNDDLVGYSQSNGFTALTVMFVSGKVRSTSALFALFVDCKDDDLT